MIKRIIYIFILIVFLGVSGVVYQRYQIEQTSAARQLHMQSKDVAPKLQVTAMRIEPQHFFDTLVATGNIKGKQTVALSFEAEGVIKEFLVNEGDYVSKGDVVARLYDKDIVYRFKHAQAKYEEAQVNVELFQTKVSSLKQLFDLGGVAENKFKEAQLELDKAHRQLNVARIEKDYAKQEIEKVTLKSPIDGVLINKQVEQGEGVVSNTLVTQVSSVEQIYAHLGIIERDLTKIKKGQRVILKSDAYSGQDFYGTIDSVPSSVKGSERSLTVKVKIDEAKQKLLPGMFVHGHIYFFNQKNAHVITNQAIHFDNQKPYVYKIVNQTSVVKQDINVSYRNVMYSVINYGLNDHDQIIVSGINSEPKPDQQIDIVKYYDRNL